MATKPTVKKPKAKANTIAPRPTEQDPSAPAPKAKGTYRQLKIDARKPGTSENERAALTRIRQKHPGFTMAEARARLVRRTKKGKQVGGFKKGQATQTPLRHKSAT